jgi:hypothetical protein
MIGYEDLTWTGKELRYRGRTLATIEPDAEWPRLYRVRLPNGDLTDLVNWTLLFEPIIRDTSSCSL